jgi:pyruvate dehydrogenase E2 component (dihydrolipoamide acetyltransferase)
MDAGTLVLWKIKPGDTVNHGDVIAEVETQKGVIEVEIFEDGVIDSIIIQPGQLVPVGTVLATLSVAGVPAGAPVAVTKASVAAFAPAGQPQVLALPPTPMVTPIPGTERRVRVSPLARKLAAELGVDLTGLAPGADGTINRAEVELAVAKKAAAPKPEPVAAKAIPPAEKSVSDKPAAAKPAGKAAADFQAGMRQAIAAAMSRANREIPHYYLETQIDMTRTLKWLESENLKRSIKDRILPAVLLIKATALALKDVPELNGYWLDDRLQVQENIHVGFAISLRQGGLVAPAIHDTDMKSLDELVEAMRDLIMRTRAMKLRSSEMSDATITLTYLGDMGVEKVFGVIYPPQVALVGFGKVREQPWAENGMLGIRQVVTATLAADHRASDGARGGLFLAALNRHLQEAEKL